MSTEAMRFPGGAVSLPTPTRAALILSAQIAQAERADEDAFADYHGGAAPDYVYEAMAQRGGR